MEIGKATEKQVVSEYSILDTEITHLGSVLSKLEDCLKPVIRIDDRPSACEDSNSDQLVPLAEMIRSARNRVNVSITRIESIIGRLEI